MKKGAMKMTIWREKAEIIPNTVITNGVFLGEVSPMQQD